MRARECQWDDWFFFSLFFLGLLGLLMPKGRMVDNAIVHTIPRPPALLTALASSAYPTLKAFNIRYVARASSEESSCRIPLHSTLDHGNCDISEWGI